MRQLNIKIDIDLNDDLTDWCNRAKQVKSNVISIAIRQFLVSSTASTLMHMANPHKAQLQEPQLDLDEMYKQGLIKPYNDLGAPSDNIEDEIDY